jgi:hypothetical protein
MRTTLVCPPCAAPNRALTGWVVVVVAVVVVVVVMVVGWWWWW